MKAIIFLSVILFSIQFQTPREYLNDDKLRALFRAYNAQYIKEFEIKGNDYENRYHVFKSNFELMVLNNNNPDSSHTEGLTPFAHLTNSEFRDYYTGFKPSSIETTQTTSSSNLRMTVPDSVDWRKTGVTPVKNQEQCGSCWAFSAIETLESREHIIQKKPLVALSAQELVDCENSKHGGSDMGCSGGLPEHGFDWISKYGIASAEDQGTYKARQGTCKSDSVKSTFNNVKGHIKVDSTVDALSVAVAEAPVSIGVAAGSNWQSYNGGILKNKKGWFGTGCKTSPLDHGVSVVGYTSTQWIVRNSWGAQWGNSGYIQLERKQGENTCGLLTDATYPTFK